MNEKVKNFFACVGGIFSVAFAVLVGIFIGRKSRGNNADSGRVSILEEQRGEFENNKRTEEQLYNDIGNVFDRIEKRNKKVKSECRGN